MLFRSLSADGRFLSFYEAGEVYALENDVQAYYRATDGSAAIGLGVGFPAISPDGKWALIYSNHNEHRRPLQLQPLGPGQPRDLPTPGLVAFDQGAWSDGGQRIVYEAQNEQGEWDVFTQQLAGGQPVRISQGRLSHPAISPDGKTVALHESGGGISLYSADGGQPVALKASRDREMPVRFANGGKSLLVIEPTGEEMVLTEIDLASGRRQPWKRLSTGSPSAWTFTATPDLKYYAYTLEHYSSVLYTVQNLR